MVIKQLYLQEARTTVLMIVQSRQRLFGLLYE
jgi:hypothetical protein